MTSGIGINLHEQVVCIFLGCWFLSLEKVSTLKYWVKQENVWAILSGYYSIFSVFVLFQVLVQLWTEISILAVTKWWILLLLELLAYQIEHVLFELDNIRWVIRIVNEQRTSRFVLCSHLGLEFWDEVLKKSVFVHNFSVGINFPLIIIKYVTEFGYLATTLFALPGLNLFFMAALFLDTFNCLALDSNSASSELLKLRLLGV